MQLRVVILIIKTNISKYVCLHLNAWKIFKLVVLSRYLFELHLVKKRV